MAESKNRFINKEQENRLYISEKVNPLIEKMLLSLLKEKPRNSVDFMINWLQTDGRKIYEEFIEPKEANLDKDMSITKERIAQTYIFSHLSAKELESIIYGFEGRPYKAGATIISQGEIVEGLYILDSGELSVYDSANSSPVKIFRNPGDIIGDYELLSTPMLPYQKTLQASANVFLYFLPSSLFLSIAKPHILEKRLSLTHIYSEMPIFSSIPEYHRLRILDAIRQVKFNKNYVILQEGDAGIDFYILFDGECCVLKNKKIHRKIKKFEYFGEVALLKEGIRTATVIAETEVTLLAIDKQAFLTFIAPFSTNGFQENMARYI